MTIPSADNDYKASEDTRLDHPTWDSVFGSIATRIRSLEAQRVEVQTVIDELRLFGLERIDADLVPLINAQLSKLNELEAAVTQAKNDIAQAQADVEELLLGVIPAGNVTENSTRVFVTPSQRTEIGALRTDLTALSNSLSSTKTSLENALNGKAPLVHKHDIVDVNGLQSVLDGKQPSGSYASLNGNSGQNFHANDYHIASRGWLTGLLDGKQPVGSYQPAGSYAALTGNFLVGFQANSFTTDANNGSNTCRFEKADQVALVLDRRGSSGGGVLSFYRNASPIATITVDSSGVAYPTGSDIRLKDDLQDAREEVSAFFDQVEIYDFRWKDSGHRQIGLIAQDLYMIEPRAVIPGETYDEQRVAYDADGKAIRDENGAHVMETVTVEQKWQVDYSRLVPHALLGIQMLREENTALKAENTSLNERLAALDARLVALEASQA